jgi:carbon-monoxide dehydrogenase medium subunit
MIDFEYHSPSSLAEAFELLETHADDARVMAGGTALVLLLKQRLAQPGHIVSLRKISGLTYIQEGNHPETRAPVVRIGALCTQRQIETSPLVQERLPLVAETFRLIATPRIRNMATIGGGLVHGDPNQDPPPTLMALGTSVVLTSANSQRVLPVEELFLDYYETAVQPGEILTSILIPPAPANSGTAYVKFLPRTADDYATVSVATVVTPGPGNSCRDVRIALGSVGTTPVHATAAEALLRGRPLTEENIRACAAAVKEAVAPLDDFRGSAAYKRDMAEVFTRRAIQQALSQSPLVKGG